MQMCEEKSDPFEPHSCHEGYHSNSLPITS
jgi:hypothetical protein